LNHTLKIAVDCRDLRIAKTGSKTYLSEILSSLKRTKRDNFILIELSPKNIFPISNNKFLKLLSHLQFIFWKQIQLPFLCFIRKCDILICTDYFLPSFNGRTKNIVVFHDAFFWEYPHHYNRLWLKMFQIWAVAAAKRAYRILAPSKYVKFKLIHYLNVDDDKVCVVYEAPKSINNIDSVNPVLTFKKSSPYLLHVGSLIKHKNLLFLIRSFGNILKTTNINCCLYLVGGSSNSKLDDETEQIKSLILNEGLNENIILKGYVDDEELTSYYKNASGYIFPSYNEGFGLPILEAMKFRLPIAASNNTCLPEIAKNAAIYFDPYNLLELELAIKKIISIDQDVLDSLSFQSSVLAEYSWDKAALEIYSICYDALGYSDFK